MVVDAYAIVDPVTMMVKPLYTLVTNVAMSRVCGAYYFTLGAEDVWVGQFLH